MGRFYQPAQAPQFVEGMYTPPWELINNKMMQEQQGYENSLVTTNLFRDIDIKHIKDPVLDERVNDIQKYYTEKSDKITQAIQKDPSSWKKHIFDIQNLGRELAKDMKEGEISNMTQNYDSFKNLIESHQEYKALYPTEYNQGVNNAMQKWQEDPLRRKPFEWNQLAKPIDTEKYFKDLAAIKPSTEVRIRDGRIYSEEGVPQAQIDRAAHASLFGSPDYSNFISQKVSFKDPSYFNQRYMELNGGNGFYEKIYRDPNAINKSGDMDMISDEEVKKRMERYQEDFDKWDKLSDKEKLKKEAPVTSNYVTVEHGAIGQLIETAKNRGYYSKMDIKGDPITAARISANASSTNQALNRQVTMQGQTLRGLTSIATTSTSQIRNIELLLEDTKISLEDLDTDYATTIKRIEESKKLGHTPGTLEGKPIPGYNEYLTKKKALQEKSEKHQKERTQAGVIAALASYKLRKFVDPTTQPTTSEEDALKIEGIVP